MLADEFTDNGVPLEPANNDPRAGMIRLRELLKRSPASSSKAATARDAGPSKQT
jgi:hypothetical protein